MRKSTDRSADFDEYARRELRIPAGISEIGQTYLKSPPYFTVQNYPALEDKDGWKRHIAEFDALGLMWLKRRVSTVDANVKSETIAGIDIARATPRTMSGANSARIVLFLHGGALVYLGGAEMISLWALAEAGRAGCTVIAVDYRMPPEHPYPAGVEDTIAVYRQLIEINGSAHIAIVGESAGAHFAAAAVLRIRDAGLPLPGALMLLVPELDLTESGDSFQTLAGIEALLRRRVSDGSAVFTPEINQLYAAGHDLADPYISPIFADYKTGFPPTYIQSGTREMFLSNAVRMHRALRKHGLDAELHIGEAMTHGGLGGASREDGEMMEEYRRFLAKHLRD